MNNIIKVIVEIIEPGVTEPHPCKCFDCTNSRKIHREVAVKKAREIIAAIRDVPDEIIEAGENTFEPPDSASAKHVWQAMIDAILKE